MTQGRSLWWWRTMSVYVSMLFNCFAMFLIRQINCHRKCSEWLAVLCFSLCRGPFFKGLFLCNLSLKAADRNRCWASDIVSVNDVPSKPVKYVNWNEKNASVISSETSQLYSPKRKLFCTWLCVKACFFPTDTAKAFSAEAERQIGVSQLSISRSSICLNRAPGSDHARKSLSGREESLLEMVGS